MNSYSFVILVESIASEVPMTFNWNYTCVNGIKLDNYIVVDLRH